MNNERMYKYFPYPHIRDPQKKIIPDMYIFIHKDDHDGMILSAGPGAGKEACATSQALLSLEDRIFGRIIFAIPTDAGKENILKELEGVKHDKRVLKVLSKEILCNWMKETSDERIRAIEEESCAYYLCKLQGHLCKYKDAGCQYEEQRKELKSADILICDYNYIISPFIRKASGFEEILQQDRTLLLIDECHMLKRRAEMIFSSSLSSNTINRAIIELDRYEYKEEKEYIENFQKNISLETSKYKKILKSQMIKNYEGFGELVLQSYDIQKFCGSYNVDKIGNDGERLIHVGEEISKMKFQQKEGIVSYTEMVGNFILRFYKILSRQKENSNIFFLKLKIDDTIYIGWIPLDVRGFLRNAITKSDKYILYSGTVKPLRLKNDVGLTFERIFIPETIESPYIKNRKDIILTKERFFNKNANEKSFLKRIIGDLDQLFPHMKRPIGIVCTNIWYKSLGLSSIYQILNEPEKQSEIRDWLKNRVPEAQLIRFNPFGRVAQSVDLSSLKSLIFLGLPYPKYGPITQERINKMAKRLKGQTGNRKAQATYIELIEPANDRIIQSVMRGLRNENDRLVVIYYDINFKLHMATLGSKNLVICKTIDEAISHLKL